MHTTPAWLLLWEVMPRIYKLIGSKSIKSKWRWLCPTCTSLYVTVQCWLLLSLINTITISLLLYTSLLPRMHTIPSWLLCFLHGLRDGLRLHVNHHSPCYWHWWIFPFWEKHLLGLLNIITVLPWRYIQFRWWSVKVIHDGAEQLPTDLVATLA